MIDIYSNSLYLPIRYLNYKHKQYSKNELMMFKLKLSVVLDISYLK